MAFDLVLKAQGDDDAMAALPFSDGWSLRSTLERAGVRFAFEAEERPASEMGGT
ncbi:hypothetical protein [Lichenibacterium dinghuense]|uniref:hypothetical protein n=1 Tax=Lichenibacterium dinghuense TaxID=2895977 RepID=UPI001F1D44F3|nr:hypothetical protein [Lichenibacterium sp. 6Y81]